MSKKKKRQIVARCKSKRDVAEAKAQFIAALEIAGEAQANGKASK